ncbi:MAG TPA: DUF1772 domain-containing protein [Candidatus Binatia bacterium]|nr:DUF1772 domain-containing protein [Candidatus Binatia bacterium]
MFECTKLLATACCGVFFGAALYISLVQHPAMLEAGSDFSARFFAPMYGRAAVMQAGLAVVGCAAAITAWLMGAGRLWLAAAVLFGSVLPFTLLVIKPVNDVLLEARDVSTPELGALLIRWGHLHWARTVASGLAFVTCLIAIVRGKAWTAGRDAPC